MATATNFLDANVLVYAYVEIDPRAEPARALILGGCRLSVQVLGEFVAVTRRKLRLGWPKIDQAVRSLLEQDREPIVADLPLFLDACRVAERYGYQQFDAQVIAAALRANVRTLMSEDMRHGQVIDGRLTIRNPFRGE